MSRRQDLMDKQLTHRTLGELVADFESSYKRYQHSLKKVRQEKGGVGCVEMLLEESLTLRVSPR